jgi:hypothetical protein
MTDVTTFRRCSSGRPAMCALLAAVLALGCADEIREDVGAIRDAAPDTVVLDPLQDDATIGGASTYECTGLRFTVRFEASIAHVELPDRTLQLPETTGVAPTQFSDGQSVLRVEDNHASLELPEGSWHDCQEVTAMDGGGMVPADTGRVR